MELYTNTLVNVKMKYGIISIVLSIIGICFVIWMNYLLYQVVLDDIINSNDITNETAKMYLISPILKIFSILVAVIGFILAVKSYKQQKILAIIGIILALLLTIITILPLWTYMVSGSALDVNVLYT